MGVTLSPELQEFVDGEIASGRYESPDEVIRAALEFLRNERDAYFDLRSEVQRRIESIERGEGIEVDSQGLARLFEGIKAETRAILKAREDGKS